MEFLEAVKITIKWGAIFIAGELILFVTFFTAARAITDGIVSITRRGKNGGKRDGA